jgi:hypothetical protein
MDKILITLALMLKFTYIKKKHIQKLYGKLRRKKLN